MSSRNMTIALLIMTLIFLALGCSKPQPAPGGQANAPQTQPTAPGGQASPALAIGHRTKASGCVSKNALPDRACTPGAIIASASTQEICQPGYSKSVRDVPVEVKDEVYAEYGIRSHSPGEYEVDHLISLELGGSNDIANLWPEPAEPRPGFHEKDEVENYLHEQVCGGAVPLSQAQAAIATDWLTIYTHIKR